VPNWCECDLTVEVPCGNDKGSQHDLLRELVAFKEYATAGKKVLETNKFIPYLKRFRVLDRVAAKVLKRTEKHINDGFNSGGYEWCYQNWGTKWGICDAEIVQEFLERKGYIDYRFETAWSPPLPVISKMSEMFPGLRFILRYFECGCAFNGIYICEKGEVIQGSTGEYSEGRVG
jgi:Ferredoxin-like domain in Api92-like protein